MDHCQLDVVVVAPDGRLCCPWFTAVCDFKTRKFLGWYIGCDAPGAPQIFTAIHRAAILFGIPSDFYMDNGKDYRSKDFAGGRKAIKKIKVEIDECDSRVSLTKALGITPHFAWIYHGQSKPIERAFGSLHRLFCRHQDAYRGPDVARKPEGLKDVKAGKKGELLHFDEFETLFNSTIHDVYNCKSSSGKTLQGRSPNDLWNEEFPAACESGKVRFVSSEALALYCTRTSETKMLRANGFYDSAIGCEYWAEWVPSEINTKVYLRRDDYHFDEAVAFRADTHECIGAMYADIDNKAAALARTESQRAKLSELIHKKQTVNRIAERTVKLATGTDDRAPYLESMIASVKVDAAMRGRPIVAESSNIEKFLMHTPMDSAKQMLKRQAADGTQDISALAPVKQAKQKLYSLECEREEAEALK